MNVEYINPFLEASRSVLKSVAGLDASVGKLYLKTNPYDSGNIIIIIGLMGGIKGQVIFNMSEATACRIASAMMMGMPVDKLDEVSKSAVSEAANMILGNTATIFSKKGIQIDITPPSLLFGETMQVSTPKSTTICVPMQLNNGDVIELDIAILE